MPLADQLYIVVLVFACLVQGGLFLFSNLHIDMSRQTRLFRWMLISSMVVSLSDICARCLTLSTEPDSFINLLSYIVNVIYFSTQACVSAMWFLYAMRELDFSWKEQKVKSILARIPLFLLIAIILITRSTGWIFTIDTANQYHRGNLFFLHPLVCIGYMAIPSVVALSKFHLNEFYIHRNKLGAIAMFFVVVLPFALLQAIWGSDYPLFCIGYTLAMMLLHINRQNLRITIDELTGVSNRGQAMRFLDFKMNAPPEKGQKVKSLYVIMVDIDKFKQINDKYGHVEGDEALKRTASVLKRSVPRSFFIGRYGGDEFIIVGEAFHQQEIQDICQTISDNIVQANYDAMLPYTFTVSIGYSVRSGKVSTIPEFVQMADQNLYRQKRNKVDAVSARP